MSTREFWYFWGPCVVALPIALLLMLSARRFGFYRHVRRVVRIVGWIGAFPLLLYLLLRIMPVGKGPEAGFSSMGMMAFYTYPFTGAVGLPFLLVSYLVPSRTEVVSIRAVGARGARWVFWLALGVGVPCVLFMMLNRLLPVVQRLSFGYWMS